MRWISILFTILVSGITSAADPLPPGAALRLGDGRFRAGGEVRHLRFSSDGAILFGWVVGLDEQLHPIAWATESGIPLPLSLGESPPELPERTAPAARLDGDRIVTAGPGNAGRVWDATSRRQLALLSGHSAKVTAVTVSQDGKKIATGSADGLIRLWDGESFHPIIALKGHTGTVRTIRISVQGKLALTAGDDGTARIWNLQTGKELRGFKTRKPADLTADGTAAILWEGTRTVVRDILTGLEVVPARQPPSPSISVAELLGKIGLCIACSPDGRTIAIARDDGTIALYESATGQQRRLLAGHSSRCTCLAFTPDGSRLLSGSVDQTVLVWPVRLRDMPMPIAVRQETHAGKLWKTMATGPAEEAYLAMARFAAEPPAAVKMARMKLQTADETSFDEQNRLADVRIVELLESIGSVEARELLEELAVGHPASQRTREARRALRRLGGNG